MQCVLNDFTDSDSDTGTDTENGRDVLVAD